VWPLDSESRSIFIQLSRPPFLSVMYVGRLNNCYRHLQGCPNMHSPESHTCTALDTPAGVKKMNSYSARVPCCLQATWSRDLSVSSLSTSDTTCNNSACLCNNSSCLCNNSACLRLTGVRNSAKLAVNNAVHFFRTALLCTNVQLGDQELATARNA
jgi:hypothetical protein